MADVYLNNKYIGYVDNPEEFRESFILERRKGEIDGEVNININRETNELNIFSTAGRALRPLIVVKEGKPLLTEKHLKQLKENELTWNDLVQQGIIEYLDCSEEENSLVAYDIEHITPDHTHMEITPYGMFGTLASLVPFANHSPGARLLMGTKNQKQGVGLYSSNFHVRVDMDTHLLHYPQKPIVRNMMDKIISYEKHPSGQNITIAIMSYEGYNIDDAIIINKSSIQRGLGRSTYFRPAISEEIRYSGGLTDTITVPDKEIKGYRSEEEYRLLEGDGIVYPEAKVDENDVVIGKTSPPRFLSSLEEYNLTSTTRRESSTALKHGEKGFVDCVLLTESEEGNKLIQVKIRDQRIPEIGDKFTSRHGQKGVIGMVVSEQDMPFSINGHTPDIIFSPHSIPSRMTISHLLELLGAKTGSMGGRTIDSTTFASEKEDDLRNELASYGFRENGTETFVNGKTGKIMTAKIYTGPMYYFRLKYVVANKIRARARGPIQLLTRQPTEGKIKEGGLRLGEMEKDTFIAHGASLLLKERFDSDKTIIPVCSDCGSIAIKDEFKGRLYCPVCGQAEVHEIEMSYAFKLLLDEMKSLCIQPRLNLVDKY